MNIHSFLFIIILFSSFRNRLVSKTRQEPPGRQNLSYGAADNPLNFPSDGIIRRIERKKRKIERLMIKFERFSSQIRRLLTKFESFQINGPSIHQSKQLNHLKTSASGGS
jgi:hypothetical protein